MIHLFFMTTTIHQQTLYRNKMIERSHRSIFIRLSPNICIFLLQFMRQDSASMWQSALQKATSSTKGAGNELERKLNRRKKLQEITAALLTPISLRKKGLSPNEQGGDGIKI
eukprot:m.99280 g.99280  ORF g.99280 m.99280 type:complete len:112 (+) comp37057_c0_seq2:5126-5461(+)